MKQIEELCFYCHVYLREKYFTQKENERMKTTRDMLEKLYKLNPKALETYDYIIYELRQTKELFITYKALVNILSEKYPKETRKIFMGYLLKQCIK